MQVGPRHPLGQRHLVLAIFHQEGGNHAQVGVRPHTILVGLHGGVALEASARLAHAVGCGAVLEIVFQVFGETTEHLQQVALHRGLVHKVGGDDALGDALHRVYFLCRVDVALRQTRQAEVVDHEATAARQPIDLQADAYIALGSGGERHAHFLPGHGGEA